MSTPPPQGSFVRTVVLVVVAAGVAAFVGVVAGSRFIRRAETPETTRAPLNEPRPVIVTLPTPSEPQRVSRRLGPVPRCAQGCERSRVVLRRGAAVRLQEGHGHGVSLRGDATGDPGPRRDRVPGRHARWLRGGDRP